jgi:hypothetical protein
MQPSLTAQAQVRRGIRPPRVRPCTDRVLPAQA